MSLRCLVGASEFWWSHETTFVAFTTTAVLFTDIALATSSNASEGISGLLRAITPFANW